jgi:hypothetical protein
MKKLLLFAILIFTGIANGQSKVSIDQRLIKNQGDNIYQIHEKQKSYYDFLLWEIDNGYEIVELEDTEKVKIISVDGVVNSNGDVFTLNTLSYPNLFNFIDYSFIREKNQDVYYDLGNGKFIKFTSLTDIWTDYAASK